MCSLRLSLTARFSKSAQIHKPINVVIDASLPALRSCLSHTVQNQDDDGYQEPRIVYGPRGPSLAAAERDYFG
jgi:hypothetical protein